MKVGIRVDCAVCGRQKCPRGRDGSALREYCYPEWYGSSGCKGYEQDPKVGDLWPRETEEDFGFPVSADGTKEVDPEPDEDIVHESTIPSPSQMAEIMRLK